MPYIVKEDRCVAARYPETSGQLNYAFTNLIRKYLRTKGHSYATFNDIVGALEGAKLEFNRRIVVEYEDKKREQNGDVY